MISGNVPKHLVVGARTGFLNGLRRRDYEWQRVAATFNMDAATEQLVDIGAAPMPKESLGGMTVQDFIERQITLSPTDWDITVWISHNAVKDDQTGELERKVKASGENFQKHLNARVFTALNGGDGTTFGLAYDGQDFFDSDHVDPGAQYTTSQDNEGAVVLTLDAFETAWAAATKMRDDQGQFTSFNYDLIAVSPELAREAANIAENPQDYKTANRAINPFASGLDFIMAPELDSTAWYLIASNESHKPLIVGMKEQPNLQHAWFDPDQPQGGYYFFKFYARYEVVYGDWRLAYQGNT
jgi:phage major head subunit gpT-like protein